MKFESFLIPASISSSSRDPPESRSGPARQSTSTDPMQQVIRYRKLERASKLIAATKKQAQDEPPVLMSSDPMAVMPGLQISPNRIAFFLSVRASLSGVDS